jgi:hypothetical protein
MAIPAQLLAPQENIFSALGRGLPQIAQSIQDTNTLDYNRKRQQALDAIASQKASQDIQGSALENAVKQNTLDSNNALASLVAQKQTAANAIPAAVTANNAGMDTNNLAGPRQQIPDPAPIELTQADLMNSPDIVKGLGVGGVAGELQAQELRRQMGQNYMMGIQAKNEDRDANAALNRNLALTLQGNKAQSAADLASQKSAATAGAHVDKDWIDIQKQGMLQGRGINKTATTAQQTLTNANRALMLLSKPIQTPQDAATISADFATIFAGKSATDLGMKEQSYNTLKNKAAQAAQFWTGSPQSALPDDIKTHLTNVLTELKSQNVGIMKDYLDELEMGRGSVVGAGSPHENDWQQLRAKMLNGGYVGGDQSATSSPAPGTVKGGYKFKGGDPADKNNWEQQ